MSDVRDSMRDYINVIVDPENAAEGICSPQSQCVPDEQIGVVSPTSQCDPSDREVHGTEYDPDVNAPLTAMNTPAATLAGRMSDLAKALQDVLAKRDGGEPEQELDEQKQEEESPEAMAPAVDSQGHQSYNNPKGDSYAEKQGFTG